VKRGEREFRGEHKRNGIESSAIRFVGGAKKKPKGRASTKIIILEPCPGYINILGEGKGRK